MKIYDIVNEEIYVPKSVIEEYDAVYNRLIANGVITPKVWTKKKIDEQRFRGRGDYDGFTWEEMADGTWRMWAPGADVNGTPTSTAPNQAAIRAQSDNWIEDRRIRIASRDGVVQGRDGRYYVNYGSGGNDDVEGFDRRRDAVRAQTQFTRNGTKTRGVRNWSEYRGAWREHQNESLRQKGSRIAVQFQGWWRQLGWLRWATRLFGIFGGGALILGKMQEVMQDLHTDLVLGLLDREDYEEAVEYMFGWLITQGVILFAASMAGGAVARILNLIRGLRTAGLVAGPIGGLVTFLLGTAVTWLVVAALNRESVQRAIVGAFVNGVQSDFNEGIGGWLNGVKDMAVGIGAEALGATSTWLGGMVRDTVIDMGQAVQDADTDIEAIRRAGERAQDPEQALGLDPRATAAARGVADRAPEPNVSGEGGFTDQIRD